MNKLTDWLIGWPERVARHLQWLAPLFARIVVGWVFMWSGWGKLHNLPAITENFAGWHIPAPQILAPFVSGVELFGGIFLLGGVIVYLVGIFSIKAAMEEYYNSTENIGLHMSGVMTFFFSTVYIQYHINRIARWKKTGVLS